MKSSKRVVKAALSTALVLAMGVATLFHAGTSYAAEEVKLNKTSRNILTRQSYDFDVVGAPKDAVITWESSDNKIATVDEDGVVTGIKKGTVTITCKVTSAGKTQTLTATAKIRKPAVKIEIKNKITELEYGKTYDLNRNLTPATSNDVTTWKSSNTKVATVDKNGVVKALKDGTVTITATTMSGKTDSVKITVFGAPEPTKAPQATATPKPAATQKPSATQAPSKPQSSTVKYDIAKMEVSSGYGYSQSGNKLTFDGQYQEVMYKLATPFAAKDCKNMKISIGSASDQVAYKLYDANGNMMAVWYGQTATAEFALTDSHGQNGAGAPIDQNTKIAVIGIMANNGACDVTITGIEFDMKAAAKPTPKPESYSYDVTKLEQSGYGYTQSGNKVAFDGQYQEVKYALPSALTVKNFKTMTVSLGSASDQVAYKLYDASGNMLAVWYGQTATAEFALTDSHGQNGAGAPIDQNAKIAAVGVMANNGACEVEITGISFK